MVGCTTRSIATRRQEHGSKVVVETRQLSLGVLPPQWAILADSGMNGHGVSGDCGHRPGGGLNQNGSGKSKEKVSARTSPGHA